MKLPVKPRVVLGTAAKAAPALLGSMHTRRAAHKAIFVHACFDHLNIHYYNLTHKTPFVKRQFVTPKVLDKFGRRGRARAGNCQGKKPGPRLGPELLRLAEERPLVIFHLYSRSWQSCNELAQPSGVV